MSELKSFYKYFLEAFQAYIDSTTHVDPKTGKRYYNENNFIVVGSNLYSLLSKEPSKKSKKGKVNI